MVGGEMSNATGMGDGDCDDKGEEEGWWSIGSITKPILVVIRV